MKIIIPMLVLLFILSLGLLPYNMVNSNNEDVQNIQNNNSLTIEDIINQVENTYYSITYFKATGQNVYTRKGISSESSIKKNIQIEYSFPSLIKTSLLDDNGETKTLVSNNNTFHILFNNKKIKDFDDLYWGVTSSEFGDGNYFENAKILILKERNKQMNSVFQNIIDLKLIGEEEINEELCYKVQGLFRTDSLVKETFWINKESFLIVQFERLMLAKKVPNGYFKTIETYYDIETR